MNFDPYGDDDDLGILAMIVIGTISLSVIGGILFVFLSKTLSQNTYMRQVKEPKNISGLTNFDPDDFHTYAMSILMYEYRLADSDKGEFFIVKESLPNSPAGYYSLYHKARGEKYDCSEFWEVFRQVNIHLPTKVRRLLARHS